MTEPLAGPIVIPGTPQQQGSKRYVGGGRMVETNRRLPLWRAEAIDRIRAWCGPDWAPLDGPITLDVGFVFARPASHWGTGRNSDRLKPSAPTWKTTAPDLDKLLRAVCDALTQAGFWRDDARLAHAHARKQWGPLAHTIIHVKEAP